MYRNIFHPVACCAKGINIARIAKAALHKLPGGSSLKVRYVCPAQKFDLVFFTEPFYLV